eukprot:8619683-Pyramimonas_sp.AAC.2
MEEEEAYSESFESYHEESPLEDSVHSDDDKSNGEKLDILQEESQHYDDTFCSFPVTHDSQQDSQHYDDTFCSFP